MATGSAPRGVVIALEGLDGAGTTTQARRLIDRLRAAGHAAEFTCQPSPGPIGTLLRAMLRGEHALPDAAIDQRCFTLLFAADRLDHWQRIVAPILARGAVVVSDRWYHSSMAYQATKVDGEWIAAANRFAPPPDAVLFVRVGAEVAAQRRHAAGRSQELFEDLATQRAVAIQYETVMQAATERGEHVTIIDGEAPLEAVTAAIWQAVAPLLPA